MTTTTIKKLSQIESALQKTFMQPLTDSEIAGLISKSTLCFVEGDLPISFDRLEYPESSVSHGTFQTHYFNKDHSGKHITLWVEFDAKIESAIIAEANPDNVIEHRNQVRLLEISALRCILNNNEKWSMNPTAAIKKEIERLIYNQL